MSPEEGTLNQLLEYVKEFLAEISAKGLKTKHISEKFPNKFFDLDVSFSYGNGVLSEIPFFALLGNDQTVTEGIYPVFLYYKKINLLILGYGISVTKKPGIQWGEAVNGKDTIKNFFTKNPALLSVLTPSQLKKIKKYGNSFVERAIQNFDLEKPSFPIEMAEGLQKVIGAYKQLIPSNNSNKKIEVNAASKSPLNLILYGPPGTGKTYTTINKALEILKPAVLKVNSTNRHSLKIEFDLLVKSGMVRFVTFHQSFSYEDFVEGIRAKTDTSGTISYSVEKGLFKDFCATADKAPTKSFVLIIDEINRGNISKIFGELITLIEPSKRNGETEALQVTLPYSKELFSVPSNVYLIGTMNTADRSLTGLDIALRRRFTFEEMPPRPELLDKVDVQTINIGNLLRRMNERIEVLLDREHCLGHAYFMELNSDSKIHSLSSIFRQKIIPLLQEYFFEDWERISWVLNDQHSKGEKFLIKQDSINDLFGSDVGLQDRRWHINEKAFTTTASYINILGPSKSLL